MVERTIAFKVEEYPGIAFVAEAYVYGDRDPDLLELYWCTRDGVSPDDALADYLRAEPREGWLLVEGYFNPQEDSAVEAVALAALRAEEVEQ